MRRESTTARGIGDQEKGEIKGRAAHGKRGQGKKIGQGRKNQRKRGSREEGIRERGQGRRVSWEQGIKRRRD